MKFASAQLEALDSVITALSRSKEKEYVRITQQLVALRDRLRKLSEPKPTVAVGIGVDRAISAMKEVLGDKLAVPRNPSSNWKIYLSTRIRDLGLTEDDCRSIARAIAVKWDPPYGFEYCIKAADRLLAESDTTVKKGKNRERAPVEMDDR